MKFILCHRYLNEAVFFFKQMWGGWEINTERSWNEKCMFRREGKQEKEWFYIVSRCSADSPVCFLNPNLDSQDDVFSTLPKPRAYLLETIIEPYLPPSQDIALRSIWLLFSLAFYMQSISKYNQFHLQTFLACVLPHPDLLGVQLLILLQLDSFQASQTGSPPSSACTLFPRLPT